VAIALVPGNPYDGHTLGATIATTGQLTGCEIERAHADKGYRGGLLTDDYQSLAARPSPVPVEKCTVRIDLGAAVARPSSVAFGAIDVDSATASTCRAPPFYGIALQLAGGRRQRSQLLIDLPRFPQVVPTGEKTRTHSSVEPPRDYPARDSSPYI